MTHGAPCFPTEPTILDYYNKRSPCLQANILSSLFLRLPCKIDGNLYYSISLLNFVLKGMGGEGARGQENLVKAGLIFGKSSGQRARRAPNLLNFEVAAPALAEKGLCNIQV
jgi:hypothetical protein